MSNFSDVVRSAEQAVADEDWQAAVDSWRFARTMRPNNRRVVTGLARALRMSGELVEARGLYARSVRRWPDSANLVLGHGQSCAALDEDDAALGIFRRGVAEFPDDPRFTIGLAQLLAKLEQCQEALDVLRSAADRWPNNARINRLLADAEKKYGDARRTKSTHSSLAESGPKYQATATFDVLELLRSRLTKEEYIQALEEVKARPGADAAPLARLALSYEEKGQVELALTNYKKAASLQPNDSHLVYRVADCLAALGRIEDAKNEVKKLIASDSRWLAYAGLARIVLGELDEADDVSERYLTELARLGLLDSAASVEEMDPAAVAALAFLQSPGGLKRRRLQRYDVKEEVTVSESGDSGVMVFVFTGFNHRIFSFPLELLDNYLASRNVTMAILNDFSGNIFLSGIHTLSPSLEGTFERLKEIAAERGARRIFVLGASGGGMAALRYGIELGAENILCFSAPTNLTEEFLHEANDTRGYLSIRRLNKAVPKAELDILEHLKAREDTPRIDLAFGAQCPGDVTQAHHLAKVKSVHLHPIDGVNTHNSLGRAFASGLFAEQLDRMFERGQVAADSA